MQNLAQLPQTNKIAIDIGKVWSRLAAAAIDQLDYLSAYALGHVSLLQMCDPWAELPASGNSEH
jgi:hypothetical protein